MAVCLWNGGEMKKGQIRTGVVRNVKFPNRAMVVLEPLEGAADGEEICEVKGALPGQKISVVITKVRKGKGEGRLKEILEKSPIETVGVENGGCPQLCLYHCCIPDNPFQVCRLHPPAFIQPCKRLAGSNVIV